MARVNVTGWLVVLLCCAVFVAIVGQSGITQTTATLSQARYGLVAASSGDLIFFAGGNTTTGPSDRVDICNVTSGSWTTATLSVPRYFLAAASSGNLVFFAGGLNGSTDYNQVDIYNTLNGSWSTATLSKARCCLAATSVGNFVLFAGGSISFFLGSNVVDMYNVTSNTWTNATLSQARGWLASTSVANRYALFAGGVVGTSYFDTVDVYDLYGGIWTSTNFGQALADLASASLNNLALFGGGYNGSQTFNIVTIYNPSNGSLSTATLSFARWYLAATSIGNIVAFGGGTTPDLITPTAVVDIYDATNNSWFTVNLSQSRYWLAATSAPSTNQMFFGGGQSDNGASNIVDIFTFVSPPYPTPTPIAATTLPSPFVPTPVSSSFVPALNIPSGSSISTTGSSASSSSPTYPSQGGIAGIVVGVLLVAIGAAIVLLVVLLRRKQKKRSVINTSHNSEEPPTLTNFETLSTESLSTKGKSYISSKEIVLEREIGEGSSGKIYLGKWNDATVVLKYFQNQVEFSKIVGEIKIAIELPPHPNVVNVFGISLDGPEPAIVMEYCSGGSLDKLLFNNNQPITNERKIQLVHGIAKGLLHLHKHNIIHRDLAARNVLLTATGEPKITDFGMARRLNNADEGQTKTGLGPVCWMAPESIATRTYSKKSDVWSFGIVVYEIVAQQEPYTGMNIFEVAVAIRDRGLTPKIPDECPQKLRQLMEMCWQKEPNLRPTIEVICAILR